MHLQLKSTRSFLISVFKGSDCAQQWGETGTQTQSQPREARAGPCAEYAGSVSWGV